jgi:putative membrane protein
MTLLVNMIVSGIVVMIAAYLVPGVIVPSFLTAVVVAVVLGLLNAFIKPVLVILTLPINILTLGLFTIVINVLLILFTASLVPGFQVDGFVSALLFGLILALINVLFGTKV